MEVFGFILVFVAACLVVLRLLVITGNTPHQRRLWKEYKEKYKGEDRGMDKAEWNRLYKEFWHKIPRKQNH